ncbi:SpaH/EbpB family LPXTG-anchored major pilin [Corynebacterium sp. NPDC060344]|uniref:SpaH/EbpB family LPXTG-anchored major pilin n=1 Tax=Corynebacterium sp. NPDC060344 TaxID=3347101 RepID=UPI003655E456
MQKNTRIVRSATFAAIVGLTLTTGAMGAVAPMAYAQAPASLIDATRTGALTIHKKADPTGLGTPTGNIDPAATGENLAGAGFTIYKINDIDLTTNAGLAAANGATPAAYLNEDGTANTALVTAVGGQETTNGEGQISYPDLALGAYLVVETAPVDGYDPAAPFIAFVPMTQGNADAGGTTWNYDVHAYPKNYKEGDAGKTVEDSGQNLGDTITYKVTATARVIAPNQTRTSLRIVDTLDARLTAPATADVTVAGFTAGDDYTVTVEGQVVTITFTEAGLAKVTNGQEIVATIPATVNAVGNGNIENTATVFQSNPNTNQEDETTTNKVESKFAGIEFTKVDEAGGNLAGAAFQVYGVPNEPAGQTCEQAVTNQANLQTVGGETTFTSGDNGVVTINGLHVNDFADGEAKPNEFVKYCLVETQSPEGYELLATPHEFELLAAQAGTLQPVTIGGEAGQVVNLKDTTPALPLTGGAGIGLIAALGALLVGAGAWWAKRNSSKA